jgi:hypothetical protein
MSHFITKCDCGNVISQCRCFSKEKIETIVPHGCAKCKSAATADDKLSHLKSALRQYFADKIPGGLGDDKPDSAFDKKQLDKGKEEEKKEHTNDDEIAKEIVKDHLTEDPEYYEKEAAKPEQTSVSLKKLHKGEQDQLAVEIRKKHVNKN